MCQRGCIVDRIRRCDVDIHTGHGEKKRGLTFGPLSPEGSLHRGAHVHGLQSGAATRFAVVIAEKQESQSQQVGRHDLF